jgi:hypothetical protein
VVQIALGIFAHSYYLLGFLHGLFAFAVLATATIAATRVAQAGAASEAPAVVASNAAPADV